MWNSWDLTCSYPVYGVLRGPVGKARLSNGHVLSTYIHRCVFSKQSWCLTSTETIRLIRDGEKGGKGKLIYLSLHCHHQNDSCIKMGSDESHFNVSSVVRVKVTRQCPQTTTFEEKGEPKRIRTEVPLP